MGFVAVFLFSEVSSWPFKQRDEWVGVRWPKLTRFKKPNGIIISLSGNLGRHTAYTLSTSRKNASQASVPIPSFPTSAAGHVGVDPKESGIMHPCL